MSSLTHSARCAFKDALKILAPTIPEVAAIPLSAIKITSRPHGRTVDLTCDWRGYDVLMSVTFHGTDDYSACLMSIVNSHDFSFLHPHTWHWGRLHRRLSAA